MVNINKFFGSLRCSILLSPRNLQTPGALRSCSDQSKLPKEFDYSKLKKIDEENRVSFLKKSGLQTNLAFWNERSAVRRLRRQNTFPRNINNVIDITNELVSLRATFPGTLKGFVYWLQKRRERQELIEQKFLPQRHAILRPDLAAAHFLVRRGGSIKFLGQKHWVGRKEDKAVLPNMFVPGLHIEAMKLEGSNLHYEGLKNLVSLEYLRSLSLKNVENVNDWWLDWISSEYYWNLKHLDLTNCKNVTYRGLSCFYRFECLETLNVEGVPDPPEFRLACVMLQDVLPELNITGIDLNIPEEITAVDIKQDISPKENAAQKL